MLIRLQCVNVLRKKNGLVRNELIVIHANIFDIKLATWPLTLKLQINIFQGFPKRYCKSELVKAFQNYILRVGNKKKLTTHFYKFEDFAK